MNNCPLCGRQKPRKAAEKWFCSCSWAKRKAESPPASKINLPSKVQPSLPNHWITLHEYGPANYSTWNQQEAIKWFTEWQSGIPSYGCSCQSHFSEMIRHLPPVMTSARAFAKRAWDWHDTVSSRINKPRMTWDECESLFGSPWNPQPNNRVKFVTALSRMEKHMARQHICLDSWKKFGAEIWCVNTEEEIRDLKKTYPQVDHWVVENEVSTDYAYPTQLIRNLANMAHKVEDRIYLINSDIETYGNASVLDHPSNTQLMGVRWNYEQGSPLHASTEFQWGIDLVSFTPEQASALPKDFPMAIGQSMWDYAVPYYALAGGYNIQFLHQRLLYHETHEINWHQDAWHFGADWLSDKTELTVNDFKSSASWRESMDPGSWYSTEAGCWMSKAGGRAVSVPLSYSGWKSLGGIHINVQD